MIQKFVERKESSSSCSTELAAPPADDDEIDAKEDFGFAMHGFLLDVPALEAEEEHNSKGKPKRKSAVSRNRHGGAALRLVSNNEGIRLSNRDLSHGLQF